MSKQTESAASSLNTSSRLGQLTFEALEEEVRRALKVQLHESSKRAAREAAKDAKLEALQAEVDRLRAERDVIAAANASLESANTALAATNASLREEVMHARFDVGYLTEENDLLREALAMPRQQRRFDGYN